jgi:hypothetical protein
MTYLSSTMLQRTLVFVFAVAVTASLISLSVLPASSSLLALAGLVGGFVWVFRSTYMNAQPASSLRQSLHDAEAAAPRDSSRKNR